MNFIARMGSIEVMPRQDWFRNTEWNPEIKATFYKKLARARKKDQYLKIQAYFLCRTFPEVALDLLEEYFATGDKFFLASAFVMQVLAHLTLGNIENAFMSYERALNREQKTSPRWHGSVCGLPISRRHTAMPREV